MEQLLDPCHCDRLIIGELELKFVNTDNMLSTYDVRGLKYIINSLFKVENTVFEVFDIGKKGGDKYKAILLTDTFSFSLESKYLVMFVKIEESEKYVLEAGMKKQQCKTFIPIKRISTFCLNSDLSTSLNTIKDFKNMLN